MKTDSYWRFLMMVVGLAALAAGVQAGDLRSGAAAIDITPRRLPVSMTGGFQDRQAMAAHDRLHARCVVLDDGDVRIAMVICDSCLISREIYDRAKQLAHEATGIPTAHMLTAATHTHTAPTAVPLAQCQPDARYVEQLTEQIAEAIITASERAQPAEIGWGVVPVPEEVSNRRWFIQPQAMRPNPFGRSDDQVRMNPPRSTGLLIRPAGPVDPDVSYLAVRSRAGHRVALLANYGLHYVGGIPAGQLSADYFGEFARRITKQLEAGSEFVGIMSNGASGDVNNYQFPKPRPASQPFERVEKVAELVAERVAESQQDVRYRQDLSIRTAERELELGIRQPDEAERKRAQAKLAAAANPDQLTTDQVYARESLLLADAPPTVKIKLQSLVVGDLAIVAIPCEVFAEIGLEIKRRSPVQTTFVIGLANGYNGYLPSPRQHELGGYETWPSSWSYLEVDASTKIVNAALEQLHSLQNP